MSASGITPDVEQFLRRYIRSVWQLELIILLKTSETNRSVDDLAKELYMPPDVTGHGLRFLEKIGIVTSTGEQQKKYYAYAPSTEQLAKTVDSTIKAYHNNRVQIVSIIFSSPIQTFSDAFLLHREDS